MWTASEIKASWRAPDKPRRVSLAYIASLAPNKYVAEAKYDGFRGVAFVDNGHVTVMSRHFMPLPVSEEMKEKIASIPVARHSSLDFEWIKRRAGGGEEGVVLLDVLYWDGAWIGSLGLIERTGRLSGLDLPDGITIADRVSDGFMPFLKQQIGSPLSEGIVIKGISAPLIGRKTDSAINPLWFKIRWRDGPGGDVQVITANMIDRAMERASRSA